MSHNRNISACCCRVSLNTRLIALCLALVYTFAIGVRVFGSIACAEHHHATASRCCASMQAQCSNMNTQTTEGKKWSMADCGPVHHSLQIQLYTASKASQYIPCIAEQMILSAQDVDLEPLQIETQKQVFPIRPAPDLPIPPIFSIGALRAPPVSV